MPLHLTPSGSSSSRRHFLKSLAGAGVVLSSPIGRAAEGGGAQAKPDRWALLSDTHVAADPTLVAREVNMADNLKRVVAEVVAEAESLDGVLIDGDCAYNDGQKGDYEILGALLKPLTDAGLPVHMTMGNHDDRGPFFEALSGLATDDGLVDGKHVSVIEGTNANWVLLDSLRFVNKVEGEFGEAQLEWLAAWLEANPDKPAILVGHHYPQVFREDVIPGDEKIKISGLIDSEPFLALAARFPQAKAYLYGHSHDWKTKTEAAGGFHEVNLPPTAYLFNPERPNGWVRATVSGEAMELELRALDPKHPQHGEKRTLAWR